MIFWFREIAGWAMIAASLLMLRIGLEFAMNTEEPKIVEAFVVTFGALGVLRAGVLLIRISTAARLCRLDREVEKSR